MSSAWHGITPQAEQDLYRAAGFGHTSGLGQRPALLVIDVQYRTVGDSPEPIETAIRTYATSCGEIGWRAVENIAPLISQFRARSLPIIFPHVAPKAAYDGGRFADKVPTVMSVPSRGYDFVREVAPRPGDILLPKFHPSAFFGTPLASHLVNQRVDSLVVTGCTTSGCVRSTVVDAFSLNYRVVVPEDCVYDRSAVSHAVNLFDMASKYADVVTSTEIAPLLEQGHV